MKKILFLLITAFTLTTTFAQKAETDWDGRLKVAGLLEHFDRGGASLVTEKNLLFKGMGAWKNYGYNWSYNLNQRKFSLNLGYAQILRKADGTTIVWSAGPNVDLLTKPDNVKTKYVYMGVGGFITMEKEKSYEVEFSTRYNMLWKHDATDASQSNFYVEADGVVKFSPIIGLGIHAGYSNTNYHQSKKNPPTVPYINWAQNSGKLEFGGFANVQFHSFELGVGPELAVDLLSYKQDNQTKSKSTGSWMLNWKAQAVYHF